MQILDINQYEQTAERPRKGVSLHKDKPCIVYSCTCSCWRTLLVLSLAKRIFLYVRYHMLEKGLTKKNDRRMNYSMDEWWASLTVDEKERIATKVAGREVHYPECSVIWNKLDKEIQQKIHDHCTDVHGLELKEWDVNEMFSC